MSGTFTISLDYELLWGGIEKRFPEDYGQSNVRHVGEVLDGLLCLFEKYGVHATVATVGLIMTKNTEEALAMSPTQKPSYQKTILSPYNNDYIDNIKKENEFLYFAPDSIRKFQRFNNIEIATHTFCHYYCWEEGQTKEQFCADIQSAINAAKAHGVELKSIIFPRNEVSDDYLKVCSDLGITTYRGNPKRFFNKQKGKMGRIIQRVSRIADTYINISGHNAYAMDELEVIEGCLNIPASRFLRPYSKKLKSLDFLRLRRIKKDIRYAAKNNLIYHLWWHPHNFGNHLKENLTFLERILEEFSYCQKEYGMQSLTMHEIQDLKTR